MTMILKQNLINDKKLLAIFPEAKEIIPKKIVELMQNQDELSNTIKKKLILIKHKTRDEFSQWFWREWVKVSEGEELLKIEGHLARLKWLLLIAKGKIPKGRISEEEIQRALAVPMETILNQSFRKSGRALVGLCPLHKENNPSFYIYPETNSFWCFGCNQGGNVINFVRLLYGYSFKEAINYLVGEK